MRYTHKYYLDDSEDTLHDKWHLHNYNAQDCNAWIGFAVFQCIYSVADDDSIKGHLRAKEMRKLTHELDVRVRQCEAELHKAKDLTRAKVQAWEVYAGDGQLATVL